ncbi:Hypothetical protein PBC10988_15350 [Planctomycetales bacterium 10988]|nr:Hypothetical protein PBC10988_15350 [Planctomycetales bacterium 10988]
MNALKSSLLAVAAFGFFAVCSTASAQVPRYIHPGNSGHHHHEQPGWYFGVSVQETHEGMLITQVVHGSPACRAGLERGDIIHSVNGRTVDCHHIMQQAIQCSNGHVNLVVCDWRRHRDVCVHVHLEPVQPVHHHHYSRPDYNRPDYREARDYRLPGYPSGYDRYRDHYRYGR